MPIEKVYIPRDVYLIPEKPHELRSQLIEFLSGGGPPPEFGTCQLCGSVLPIDQIQPSGCLGEGVCQQCRNICGEPEEGWEDFLEERLEAQAHRACDACQVVLDFLRFHRVEDYWLCDVCAMWVNTMLETKKAREARRED